jgi:hypothetical protein
VLADIAMSSAGDNPGAVMIEHSAGPDSSFFDFHMQLFTAVHTGVHVTGDGAGLFTNMWIWGADHNLTDNTPMQPHLSAATGWLGGLSGETPTPLLTLTPTPLLTLTPTRYPRLRRTT